MSSTSQRDLRYLGPTDLIKLYARVYEEQRNLGKDETSARTYANYKARGKSDAEAEFRANNPGEDYVEDTHHPYWMI